MFNPRHLEGPRPGLFCSDSKDVAIPDALMLNGLSATQELHRRLRKISRSLKRCNNNSSTAIADDAAIK